MKTRVSVFKELSKKNPTFLIKYTKVKVIALRLLEETISIEIQSFSFRSYNRKLLHSIFGSCSLLERWIVVISFVVQQEEYHYC